MDFEVIDTTKEIIEYKPRLLNILPCLVKGVIIGFIVVVLGLKFDALLFRAAKNYLDFEVPYQHWFRFAAWVIGAVFFLSCVEHVGTVWDKLLVFNDTLTFTSGVISRQTISLPFRSISAIRRKRTFYQRLLGIEDVIFYGYGGFCFKVHGVVIPLFSPYEDPPEAVKEA